MIILVIIPILSTYPPAGGWSVIIHVASINSPKEPTYLQHVPALGVLDTKLILDRQNLVA